MNAGSLGLTWKHLEGLVGLKAEQQSAGCDAEDLPRAEVHAVVHLEVEAARHGAWFDHRNMPQKD